ncbi:MAG: type IV pilus modification protein PilV [Gammaproteobacteria bacterium]|nr:type IV pilus modification protein PilV [Gammaproteobacteria bacterium]
MEVVISPVRSLPPPNAVVNRSRRQQAGFTLIEVMVAAVIVSIGMFGIAALQLNGLHAVSSSGNRAQVNLLMDTLIEMMQANPTGVTNGNYQATLDSTMTIPIFTECAEYYSGSSNVSATSCTPAALAAYDVNTWFYGTPSGINRSGGVVSQLPVSPVVTINCRSGSCADGQIHDICISWQEQGVVDSVTTFDCAGTAVAAGSTQMVIYSVTF